MVDEIFIADLNQLVVWIWIPKVVWLYHQRKLRNDDCKCMWPKGTSFSGFIVEQAWQLYFMKQEHLMLLYLLPYVSIFLIWMKADTVKNDFVWVQITEISPWKKWHNTSPNHNIYLKRHFLKISLYVSSPFFIIALLSINSICQKCFLFLGQ